MRDPLITCEYCGERMEERALQSHRKSRCPGLFQRCPKCKRWIKKDEYEKHSREDCPKLYTVCEICHKKMLATLRAIHLLGGCELLEMLSQRADALRRLRYCPLCYWEVASLEMQAVNECRFCEPVVAEAKSHPARYRTLSEFLSFVTAPSPPRKKPVVQGGRPESRKSKH